MVRCSRSAAPRASNVNHVALLDLGLPVMDGFELAHRLRALPETHSIDIAAISGDGQELDRSRTREAGFSEHLVKPVDIQRLGAWLESRVRRPSSQG